MPYADEQPKKKRRVVKLPKPKHAEYYTSRECALFQPLHIVLQVVPSPGADPVEYELYLRAASQDDAMWTAFQIFNAWEHPSEYREGNDDYNPYRDGLFPQIYTGQEPASTGEKISEEEWDTAWKDTKKLSQLAGYRLLKAPQNDNPSIFRLERPGWKKTTRMQYTDGKSIIIEP